jgi:hypothetical protein
VTHRRCVQSPLLGVLVVACATQRLLVPNDIGSHCAPLVVKDRSRWGSFSSEGFKLGAYSVKGVDRASGESEKSENGATSHAAESRGGGYVLVDGSTKLEGQCETQARVDKTTIVKPIRLHSESAAVRCSCSGGERAASVVLSGDIGHLRGTLETGSGRYVVTSLHEVDKGAEPEGPTGYRVDGERPIGAVDVLFPGGAWLDPKLDEAERRELACVFAGLMLYQAPEPD